MQKKHFHSDKIIYSPNIIKEKNYCNIAKEMLRKSICKVGFLRFLQSLSLFLTQTIVMFGSCQVARKAKEMENDNHCCDVMPRIRVCPIIFFSLASDQMARGMQLLKTLIQYIEQGFKNRRRNRYKIGLDYGHINVSTVAQI